MSRFIAGRLSRITHNETCTKITCETRLILSCVCVCILSCICEFCVILCDYCVVVGFNFDSALTRLKCGFRYYECFGCDGILCVLGGWFGLSEIIYMKKYFRVIF